MSRKFYVRTYVDFTRANKIEVMDERVRSNVKLSEINFYVDARPSIYFLYFIYAPKINATMEIHP